jgi:hypothetical protein
MSSSLPPLLPHATRDLARFAAGTRFADIPAGVIEKVKLSLLDGLGVCLHGSTLPWTRMVRDVVLADGGKPIASVWNGGARVGLTGAVLVNSTAGHAFEMDDIHKESILHPNSLSVPTALALAESDPSLTGRDILAAMALGAEIGTRIGNAATMALFLNGFHPQGTSGALSPRSRRGIPEALARADAARHRHRGLARRRADGGAGGRHGEAPACRSRRTGRHDRGPAGEEGLHRHL